MNEYKYTCTGFSFLESRYCMQTELENPFEKVVRIMLVGTDLSLKFVRRRKLNSYVTLLST